MLLQQNTYTTQMCSNNKSCSDNKMTVIKWLIQILH